LIRAHRRNADQSIDVIRIGLESLTEQFDHAGHILRSLDLVGLRTSAHNQIDGIRDASGVSAHGFRADHFDADAAREAADNLFLELSDIPTLFVEALGPEMLVGFCIDQLDTDAEMARTSRDGALQYIADAEFLPDLPDGDRPTLVAKE
jgi:hypothetical protein